MRSSRLREWKVTNFMKSSLLKKGTSPSTTPGMIFANSIVETEALECEETRRAASSGNLSVNRRLDVRRAVPVQTGRGNGLGENNADRNEDSSRARSKRHSHFYARAFWVLVAAAKADSTLGQVFANHHFFRKAAPPDARQHARLHARAVPPRYNAFFACRPRAVPFKIRSLRN